MKDSIAILIIEVQVDVWGFFSRGINEAFKEHMGMPKRVDFCDSKQVTDKRTRSTTAGRSNWNFVVFRPSDNVRRDQKVVDKALSDNDFKFHLHSCDVLGLTFLEIEILGSL